MSIHSAHIPATIPAIGSPQPGELWQIRCDATPGTIAMIVHEATAPTHHAEAPSAVRVMLVSPNIAFQSDLDILVPMAGEADYLALTWLVFSLDRADLIQPMGIRWSRAIYDCLLDIGDRHHTLTTTAVNPTDYGLVGGLAGSHQQAVIQAFHVEQRAIAEALTQRLAQANHRFYAMQAAAQLLEAAIAQTIDLTASETLSETPSETPSETLGQTLEAGWINLSQWCETVTAAAIDGWDQLFSTVMPPQFAPALRGHAGSADPAAKSATIAALVDRLQTTADDETLWATVESLWQLDPGNPAAGGRRVKVMDFGMQVAGEAVALAVAIVPQGEAMAVLLQVYPTGDAAYLPEDLQLILLDESGQVLREIQARPADIYIQLKLSGTIGERFSVRVALGESGLTENFVM
jgi:Protein of unknown function (DUF1822)